MKFIKTLIFIVLALLVVIVSSCNGRKSSEHNVLTFNNNSSQITYNPDIWKEFESTAGPMIQASTANKAVAIGAARLASTKEESQYIEDFKAFMQNNSVDGNVIEETLNNYSVLTYTQSHGDFDITYSVMVVKDGSGYYEVTLACYKDLYEDYRDLAFEVMKTFNIVTPTTD